MDGDAIIKLDHGGINARILAKEARADFRRVEAASRKIDSAFLSPEGKRLFLRYFNSLQLSMYFISVIARTRLSHEMVERIEATMKAQLESAHAAINTALDGAELLCRNHGITRLATYDTAPLALEAKVISAFGRRYLELIGKIDQLMPMLETLAIDEVIDAKQLDMQRAATKRLIRQIAGSGRNLAFGVRQRMDAMSRAAAAHTGAPSGERQAPGAGASADADETIPAVVADIATSSDASESARVDEDVSEQRLADVTAVQGREAVSPAQ